MSKRLFDIYLYMFWVHNCAPKYHHNSQSQINAWLVTTFVRCSTNITIFVVVSFIHILHHENEHLLIFIKRCCIIYFADKEGQTYFTLPFHYVAWSWYARSITTCPIQTESFKRDYKANGTYGSSLQVSYETYFTVP